MTTVNNGYVMYNVNNAKIKNTTQYLIMLDFDWTIVKPKEARKFPKNVDDWEWLYSTIPKKIKAHNKKNCTFVIFTNQSKEWKHEQIQEVVKKLDVPMFIMVATDKKMYKPNIDLYNEFFKLNGKNNNKISLCKSRFIGDALGRKGDFSDSDKIFAKNIGVKCMSPEEFFLHSNTDFYNTCSTPDVIDTNNIQMQPEEKKDANVKEPIFKMPKLPLYKTKAEVIIMVGIQGSGKTSIANAIGRIKNKNGTFKYEVIHGDEYKTSKKMIKRAQDALSEEPNKSIVFDATNSSVKKRLEYIEFINNFSENHKIKCFYVATPMEISYERNCMRSKEQRVPRIAYSVYNKHFEMPSEKEGFKLHVFYGDMQEQCILD
jgi:bifunctional polynucleotide phosphatase/kinase